MLALHVVPREGSIVCQQNFSRGQDSWSVGFEYIVLKEQLRTRYGQHDQDLEPGGIPFR